MWPVKYEDLLAEWCTLREQAAILPIEESLHLINDFWARAPIINNYLHISDYEDWPLPWDLLSLTGFCDVAKSLAMCYTIILIEHKDINKLEIVQNNISTIVYVNGGEFILNDELGTIKYTDEPLDILHSVDCEYFKNKII